MYGQTTGAVGRQREDVDLIEAATIQNKTQIMERIAKTAEQANQIQQQQAQVAMEEAAARTNLANKRAIADEGLGVERYSRVEENRALADERRSEAVKDDYQALLNYVRAAKEMETVDLDDLMKIVQIKKMLETDVANKPSESSVPLKTGMRALADMKI